MKTINLFGDNYLSIDVGDFIENPIQQVKQADYEPLVIKENNKPQFICLSIDAYDHLLNQLDDVQLTKIIRARRDQEEIDIDLDGI